MAQRRLSMRKIYEVLRLTWECKLSHRAVARSCNIGYGTVCAYLRACSSRRALLAPASRTRCGAALPSALPRSSPSPSGCAT